MPVRGRRVLLRVGARRPRQIDKGASARGARTSRAGTSAEGGGLCRAGRRAMGERKGRGGLQLGAGWVLGSWRELERILRGPVGR